MTETEKVAEKQEEEINPVDAIREIGKQQPQGPAGLLGDIKKQDDSSPGSSVDDDQDDSDTDDYEDDDTQDQDDDTTIADSEKQPETDRSGSSLDEIVAMQKLYGFEGTPSEFVQALARAQSASAKATTEEVPQKDQLENLLNGVESEDGSLEKVATMFDKIVGRLDEIDQRSSQVAEVQQKAEQSEVQRVADKFEGNFDRSVDTLGDELNSILGKGATKNLKQGSKEFANRQKLYSGVSLKAQAYIQEKGVIPSGQDLQEIVTQEARGLFYDEIHKKQASSLGDKLDKRAAQVFSKGDHETGRKATPSDRRLAAIGLARKKYFAAAGGGS